LIDTTPIEAVEAWGGGLSKLLAISYGDQWTNRVQPFWTIPLLAVAGLDIRKIIGAILL